MGETGIFLCSGSTPPPRACAPVCIAFRLRNGVSTRDMNLCGVQWLAYVLLCRRFAAALAGDRARLEIAVDRYSFIVSDVHPGRRGLWTAQPLPKMAGEPNRTR